MKNLFLQQGALYQHKTVGYTAKYIGKGYRNKHTYEVINGNGVFKQGDLFTPNKPEQYFNIIN